MATQKDFNFRLNTKSLLHSEWNGISFFWESGEDCVFVEGNGYDRTLFISKSDSSTAKRAMVKFIGDTFNV